jgi:hypothetical protein
VLDDVHCDELQVAGMRPFSKCGMKVLVTLESRIRSWKQHVRAPHFDRRSSFDGLECRCERS